MNLRSAITVTIDITGIPKLLKKFYQGNELISKKSINPHSKKVDTNHNRDLVSQNEWLRQHLFNGVGKYCTANVVYSPYLEYLVIGFLGNVP